MYLRTLSASRRTAVPAILLSAATMAAASATPLRTVPSDPEPGQLLEIHCAAAEQVAGQIGRTVPVHTDTDGRLDLIAKIDDQLIWLTGPDPLQFSSPVGIAGVTAFAAMPRFGDGLGGLIVATPAGLEAVQRNVDQPRFFDAIRKPIGDASWNGARSIVVADFDGDGDGDIAGLSADGQTLLVLYQDAAANFGSATSSDLGVEVSMLTPVTWGGGQEALAGVMGDATPAAVVFDVDGFVLDSIPLAMDAADLVALEGATSAGVDALAILVGSQLTVLRPGGYVETPVGLISILPTSMSSADVNGDGRADLLLNSTISDQVVVALGQDRSTTGGQTLVAPTAASTIVIPLGHDGVDMSGQRANPVGADFDRDGDVDVFQLLEPTRGGLLQRNALVDETLKTPLMVGADWFLNPGSSFGFLTIDVPPMNDGLPPNFLELLLSSSPVAGESDAEETHKVLLEYEVGSVIDGATGLDMVYLPFPGDLGPTSTLLIRGLRTDSATGETSAGTEMSYRLVRTTDSGFRGTDGGVDRIPGGGGRQGTPPPPPPGGPIDPFGD